MANAPNNAAQADEFVVRGFGKLVASPLSRQTVMLLSACKPGLKNWL